MRKKIPIFILKLFLWVIAAIIFLTISALVVLQFPKTQYYLTQKATVYISNKIKSKVKLSEINIEFPKSIALRNLYVEDLHQDTLLYSHKLTVDIDLWKLLSKKILINDVLLEGLTANVYREYPDTSFNYSFIPNAFKQKDKKTVNVVADTNKSAWSFSIKKVTLKKINLSYKDTLTGINAVIALDQLKTKINEFDLQKNKLHIDYIELKNTNTTFVQNTPLKKEIKKSKSVDFDIQLNSLALSNIKATYLNGIEKTDLRVDLGSLLVNINKLDFKNKQADIENISLSKTSAIYTLNKKVVIADTLSKTITENKAASADGKASWKLMVAKLNLENNSVGYNNMNEVLLKKGMDFNHLTLYNTTIKAKAISATPQETTLSLTEMNLKEKCGFYLKNFNADILYSEHKIELANLDLKTNYSKIGNYIGIQFKDIKLLKDSIGSLSTKINLDKTSIAIKDILFFKPDLLQNSNIKNNENTIVSINANINGLVDNLQLTKLEISTQQNTIINLKGTIKNVRTPKLMFANLTTIDIETTKNDICQLVEKKVIPPTISLPETIKIEGAFKGYLKNFNTNMTLLTSIGKINTDIKMNPDAGNKEQPYDAKISISKFDLGKLLNKPDMIGLLSMDASILGSGIDTNTVNAKLNATIKSLVANQYEYKNMFINGEIHQQAFIGNIEIVDKNLAFNFDGEIDMNKRHPKYDFKLDLKGADLMALNLSKKDMRISGLITSDLNGAKDENIVGEASIKNLLVIKDGNKSSIESIVLKSAYSNGIADISLKSPIVTANFTGDIILKQLPVVLKNHMNTYFNTQQEDKRGYVKPQKFKFNIKLIDPTILTDNLIPNLKTISPSSIDGIYDSEAKKIKISLSISKLEYGGITMDTIQMNITSNKEKLDYKLQLANIFTNSVKMENIHFDGNVKNNKIDFQLNSSKNDSTKMLALGGILESIDKSFVLRLHPNLILNNTTWSVKEGNHLDFTSEGLRAENLILLDKQQSISIQSIAKEIPAPLEIKFKNFEMETLSKIIQNDTTLAEGVLDGKIVLKTEAKQLKITSDLLIKDFAFKTIPLGNIALKVNNTENAKKYNVNLTINGNQNNINVTGFYNTDSTTKNNLNFLVDLNNLNLASVEPYTFGQAKNLSGKINGKIDIEGAAAAPIFNGVINFKDCIVRPTFTSSIVKIADSKIRLSSQEVRFNQFKITDSLNHSATVDGKVDIHDLKKIIFDLQLKTDNFLALSTTEKPNSLYFGTIFLNSNIYLKGSPDSPQLNVNVKINKGSEVTYLKPQNVLKKNEHTGIVLFVDTIPVNHIIMKENIEDNTNTIKGMDLEASIEFDPDVKLKMIVDPISGDSLYIKGEGKLKLNINPNGTMSLVGKYNINDGGYHLKLNDFIEKDFKVGSGSYVSWSGNVVNPYANIIAIYKIKTSPIDLVQDELAGLNPAEKNKYRNLLTFLVQLKMEGFVANPQISFDIQQPPNEKGAMNGAVNAKLNQLRENENQLNKQVFALLTINRFIAEDPFESANESGGLSSATRSSASRILTSQLNQLSQKYVKGVDLNLGVNSYDDYSSGKEEGRTQLQVGISKQLFDNKVTVNVGGNIDVEGEKATQNNASNIAGNVVIEYKLTDDGRYKLRGFRKNEYENAIEGELIKTGFGIMYTRNYNKIKQLFSKPKSKEVKE
ncbi:MAG: translocation/assembly module TamB domain-containing protein [Bacteroidia bacterium]